MVLRKEHLTVIGKLFLYEANNAIVGLAFDSEKRERLENVLIKSFGTLESGDNSELLLSAGSQVDEYLTGFRKDFDLPLNPLVSDFQRKVFDALEEVEYGSTATYFDIAEKIGMKNAYRAVGNALGANPMPIIIPCHRINARDGMTSGYIGGISAKRKLLQIEADKTVLDNTEIKSQNELQNPLLTEYIRNTIKPQNDFEKIKKYAYENNVPISKPETLSFIACILQMVKPKRILEIGTAVGYSALFMQNICPQAEIVTIERDEEMIAVAKENLKNSTVELVCGDATKILKSLDREFDFVFVDAAKGQYINFYPEVMRLLSDKGVALYDNVLYKGLAAGTKTVAHKHRTITRNLEKFNSMACLDERIEATLIPVGDGLLLTVKK